MRIAEILVAKGKPPIGNLDNLSDDEQIAAIKQDWRNIRLISNPSPYVQLSAVKLKALTIQYDYKQKLHHSAFPI